MKRCPTVGLWLGVLITVAAASASAQTWGRPKEPSSGVCFYEHANFDGQYFCSRVGSNTEQVPSAADNQISSIRIFGDAQVIVYRDGGFRGQSKRFDSDIKDLHHEGWNDRISSFRVEGRGYGSSGNWGGGDWDSSWGHPRTPSSGACFYKNPDYGGDYFCAPIGANAAQVPSGTNDRISSIRVYGNAEVTVFQDSHFEGRSSSFDSNMNDLRRAGWNDLVSSFRIRTRSHGGDSHGGSSYAHGSDTSGSGHSNQSTSRWTYQQAEAMVQRAYRSVLERDSDPGARGWVDEVMKHNWSEQQLQAELRKTPEYKSKHGR